MTHLDERIPFKVGQSVVIRSVTFHHLGRIKEFSGSYVILEKASWLAESGVQFGKMMEKGIGGETELEFVGDAAVNCSSVVDVFLWKHDLPTTSQ